MEYLLFATQFIYLFLNLIAFLNWSAKLLQYFHIVLYSLTFDNDSCFLIPSL